MLTAETTTKQTTPLDNCILFAVLGVAGYFAYKHWERKQEAIRAARAKCAALTSKERHDKEIEIIDLLSRMEPDSASIETLAEKVGEHSSYMLELTKGMCQAGYVTYCPTLTESEAPTAIPLSEESIITPTAIGYRRLREVPAPNITHHNYGDNNNATHGGVVISRSSVGGSVSGGTSAELSSALKQLEEIVKTHGDRHVQDMFDGFTEELNSPTPRRGMMEALLGGMQSALPAASGVANLVEKITQFIT